MSLSNDLENMVTKAAALRRAPLSKEAAMKKQASIATLLALLGGGVAGGYGGAKGIAALVRKLGTRTRIVNTGPPRSGLGSHYRPRKPSSSTNPKRVSTPGSTARANMKDLLEKSLGGISGGSAAAAGGVVGGGLGGIGAQALMEAINGNGRLG